jgi:hypothetical protein
MRRIEDHLVLKLPDKVLCSGYRRGAKTMEPPQPIFQLNAKPLCDQFTVGSGKHRVAGRVSG